MGCAKPKNGVQEIYTSWQTYLKENTTTPRVKPPNCQTCILKDSYFNREFPQILKKTSCGIGATKGPFGCRPPKKRAKSLLPRWPHLYLVIHVPLHRPIWASDSLTKLTTIWGRGDLFFPCSLPSRRLGS